MAEGLKVKGECLIRIIAMEDGRIQTMFQAKNISLGDVMYGMELLKHDWVEKTTKGGPSAVPGFNPRRL